jgi:hypothetical protein
MHDHDDARIGLRSAVCLADRPVAGRVVDDVDAVDELWDPSEGGLQQELLVVGGNYDAHRLSLDHPFPFASLE